MTPTTRVVVVGGGMVGTRFVADLTALDTAGAFDVTVLGAEPYEPYNRVLLTEVVAGAVDVAALTMPDVAGDRVRVQRGTAAVAVDRDRRVVLTAQGCELGYDVLVLATGARARMPDVAGLGGPGSLPAGVHALRTVDDCREVVAGALNASRAVVLGGGLLGVEAARGLTQRGLEVTVVHAGAHLLDRHLDAEAAGVLQRTAARHGLSVRAGAGLAEVLRDAGRLAGVRLAGGEVLPADLLVLAVGVEPDTALASGAGLPVDRGVVVGADLRSPADPRVAAIGDCSQPPDGGTGLVSDGWAQGRRLAEQLTGGVGRQAPAAATGPVVVLKAADLPVVTMGRSPAEGDRAVRLSDPGGGRHVEVVVRDGALVGATCVGAPDVAADLTAAFDRGTPLPVDPALLLLRPAGGAVSAPQPSSPTLMPDGATVCRCNGVTKGDVVRARSGGATSVAGVAAATRATTGCGGCTAAVCGLLEWLEEVDPPLLTGAPLLTGTPEGGAKPGVPVSNEAAASTVPARGRSSQSAGTRGEDTVARAKRRATVGETRAS